MTPFQRLCREPLAHFAVLGALIFTGQLGVDRWKQHRKVLEADQELAAGKAMLEQELGHAPSAAEEEALTQRALDEELLFQEALHLGLDKGDEIVRRRLVQKMLFFAEDLGAGKDPTDAEAQAYETAHPELYARPERVTFIHRFFGGDAVKARAVATAALPSLKRGEAIHTDSPFALGERFVDRGPQQLETELGPDFERLAMTAPIGQWVGPVTSPFGVHLIKVEQHQAQQVPPLAEVIARVRGDLIETRRAAARDALLASLRSRRGLAAEQSPGQLILPPTLASEESQ